MDVSTQLGAGAVPSASEGGLQEQCWAVVREGQTLTKRSVGTSLAHDQPDTELWIGLGAVVWRTSSIVLSSVLEEVWSTGDIKTISFARC